MEKAINKITFILVQAIQKNGYQLKYSQEVLTFGVSHILQSGFAITLALVIGLLSGYGGETLYYLIVFVIIRGLCGGYHAKKPLMCLTLFLGGVIISVVVASTNSVYFLKGISFFFLISYIIILLLSPIGTMENPIPKEYLCNRKKMIMIACIVSFIINICVASVNIILSLFGACAILWCGFLIIIAKLTRKR